MHHTNKRRRGGLAVLVAGLTALAMTFITVGAASSTAKPVAPQERAKTISNELVEIEPAKIRGTWSEDGMSGRVVGKFMPTSFEVVDGAIQVTGTASGVVTGKLPDGVDRRFNETGITATVQGASSSGAPTTDGVAFQGAGLQAAGFTPASSHGCDILNLDLGPLDLNVLGLQVDLAPVVLDIVAQPGSGALLGNLLCAVAGLLDPGSALGGLIDGLLGDVVDALNGLLDGVLDISDGLQGIIDGLTGLTGATQTASA